MNISTTQRRIMRLCSVLLLGLLPVTSLLAQRPVVTHNINTEGSLTITPALFGNDYVITGTGVSTTNTVVVQSEYEGTITLNGVNMTNSATSCIHVQGQNNLSNLTPITKTSFILQGANYIENTGTTHCAIQVDQGAQIYISAIDPNDNASGTLEARCPIGSGGAAAIGAPNNISTSYFTQGSSTTNCSGGSLVPTSGGNIIISSGTIDAQGGYHGAGIGGGWWAYYNGIIIIYGGVITARGGGHAAGIGSGCPTGSGVTTCYADNSAVIALPPAQITATGHNGNSNYGLTGAKNITYINDPNKSLITVRTVDFEPNANIYLDLTETTGLVPLFTTLGIGYDLTKVRVGRTNASGVFEFHAELQQNTTFFTDASSSQTATLGRPYLPVVTTVTSSTTVVLPLLSTNISFTDYPSTPLEVGYTVAQAGANAHRIKVEYGDATPMTNVAFQLQDGSGSNFAGLQFFAADGTTPIATPTTFTTGMVFYIAFPIKQGKPVGVYSDVLLIDGKFGGIQLPGYIRRIGQQRVVINDSPTNTYIKVTASPNQFTVAHPTTSTVTLTLNIDHSGTSVLYDQLDVRAKYLVTTIADYDAALAASPLSGSDWQSLNIPAANNTNATTTVSFSGKAIGTYYIHWYVESGVVYAHSLTVTAPPRTYGGFGPYTLLSPEVTLSLNKASIDEGGGAATGTATLTARLGGTALAPTGGITVPLTYSGTATHITDYTAPTSITIPEGVNSGTVSIVALADYLLEGNETATITASASVTTGSITYSIIGSPLSLTIVDKTDGAVTASWAQDAAEPNTKGRATFKFSGTGATAVSCTRPVKVEFSYSGVSAAGNYTANSPAEAIIPAGQDSVTVDVITPINNNVVEGTRQVVITITSVTRQ